MKNHFSRVVLLYGLFVLYLLDIIFYKPIISLFFCILMLFGIFLIIIDYHHKCRLMVWRYYYGCEIFGEFGQIE